VLAANVFDADSRRVRVASLREHQRGTGDFWSCVTVEVQTPLGVSAAAGAFGHGNSGDTGELVGAARPTTRNGVAAAPTRLMRSPPPPPSPGLRRSTPTMM
jgi:hypothetical protein